MFHFRASVTEDGIIHSWQAHEVKWDEGAVTFLVPNMSEQQAGQVFQNSGLAWLRPSLNGAWMVDPEGFKAIVTSVHGKDCELPEPPLRVRVMRAGGTLFVIKSDR